MADVQKIEMVKMAPPEIIRETKYPWKEMAEAGVGDSGISENGFIIRCENEEEAKKVKGNVSSSGFAYYSNNELPFAVVPRVFEHEGKWVVGVWIKTKTD